MLTNNFFIIGTAITDFELKTFGEGKFAQYEIIVELEDSNKEGKTVSHAPVYFFTNNRNVNFNKKFKGKQVIVAGRISTNTAANGGLFIRLIGEALALTNKMKCGIDDFQNGEYTDNGKEID